MIRDDTHLQFLQLTVLQFSENKSLGVIDQSLWHNPHAFASDPLKEAVFIRLRLTLFKYFLVCQEIQESDSQYSEFVLLAMDVITYNDNLTKVVID